MVLADLAIDSNGYRILLALHLLTVIVGFGSTFVYSVTGPEAGRRRGVEAQAIFETNLRAANRVTTPVIYAAGIIGLVLALVGPWELGDPWLSASMAIFVAMVLFAALVHVPNLKRMDELTRQLASGAATDPAVAGQELARRGPRAGMNGGILHLGFAVLLVLMIWKPGA